MIRELFQKMFIPLILFVGIVGGWISCLLVVYGNSSWDMLTFGITVTLLAIIFGIWGMLK